MDPACSSMMADDSSDEPEHVVAVVLDAGAELVSFFVDGLLCDGGGLQFTGWFWTATGMGRVMGDDGSVALGSGLAAAGVLEGMLYQRTLLTSELVAYYRTTLT